MLTLCNVLIAEVKAKIKLKTVPTTYMHNNAAKTKMDKISLQQL